MVFEGQGLTAEAEFVGKRMSMGKMTAMVQTREHLPRCHRARRLGASKNDDEEEKIREKKKKPQQNLPALPRKRCMVARLPTGPGVRVHGRWTGLHEEKSRAEVVMSSD